MSLPKTTDPNKINSPAIDDPSRRSEHRTCCALLTGTGRSAVAVIAIRGEQAEQTLLRCFQPATQRPFSPGEIRFGLWRNVDQDVGGEAVVVTPLDHDSLEVHCHGGPAAIARITDGLQRMGVALVDPSEWPSDSQIPLVIAEAQGVLVACQTTRTAAVALDQLRGAMPRWAASMKRQVADDGQRDISLVHAEIRRLLAAAVFGIRLAEPFRVVLCGPPNVGKSSLVNAIVGYDRSITLDQPGTTRDVLHADTVIDGIPIRLSDTAGIRDSVESIEREGISRARTAVGEADLVLCIEQPGVEFTLNLRPTPTLRVLNKADLLPETGHPTEHDIRTVATGGEGIENLMRAIVAELIASFPKSGMPVPLNTRQSDCLAQMLQTHDPDQLGCLLDQLVTGK